MIDAWRKNKHFLLLGHQWKITRQCDSKVTQPISNTTYLEATNDEVKEERYNGKQIY